MLLSLTTRSCLRENIGNKRKKMFFLTLKIFCNILTDDIPVVRSGSNEQTNSKKSMDSYETINSSETESAAQIKEKDLQSMREIVLWKENAYLYKNHILNEFSQMICIIITVVTIL